MDTTIKPKVLNTTIKVARKDGQTVITDSKGHEWMFDFPIETETAIASLVYQTLYRAFDIMSCYSSNFEIEFTMVEKVNK